MRTRQLSGAGCWILIILALIVIMLLGRISLTILRFFLLHPIGWVALAVMLLVIWRKRPAIKVYRNTVLTGRGLPQRPAPGDDDYVTLDEDDDTTIGQDE